MLTTHVTYFGDERDDHGMPVPFYSYQIYAEDLPAKGGPSAVATILSITGGVIAAGSTKHFPLTTGTSADAQRAARHWLGEQPSHKGLRSIG